MENIVFLCLTGSYMFGQHQQLLSIDLIFHPTSLTAAAPALSFACLIDVIGHKAALPVRTRHILIIVTLGILGGSTGILCHDVCWHAAAQSTLRQFGTCNVTKGVRSLYGIG